MAGTKYQLSVIAKGDTRDATNALAKLENRAGRTSKRVRSAAMDMGKATAAGMVIVAAAVGAASVKVVGLASDAAETQGKLEVTFGKTLPSVTKRLDEFSKATGASRYALREQAATIGALLKPMKLGGKETADMSVKVTQLATDLSSFNNVPVDDALASLKSGLTGETEPLKKFGILMNEAAIEAEAVRLGLIETGGTLNEQQKVQARYSLILAQTTDAQGDAVRTSGSLANRMRALQNRIKDTATDLGRKLMPAALSFVNAGMRVLDWMQKAVQKGGTLRPMIDGVRTGFVRLKDALVTAGAAFVSGFNGPSGQSAGSARDVAAAIGDFAARAGELAQKYLPPLAQMLGQVSRFLFDHRGAIVKATIAAALLDKGVKAVRLSLTAYGAAARTVTKLTQLYRLAKWNLAAAEVKSRIATVASTVATKAQAVASRAAAIATRLLNAAMRANPVGLVITAITLLAGAMVLAYKKSDRFRAIVNSVWSWIKKAATRVMEFKEYLLLLAGPAGAMVLAYQKSDKFRAVIQKVVGKLREVGSTIKDTVLDTVTKLRKAFDKLLDKLEPVAKTLGKIGGALGKIGKAGGKAASALPGIGDGVVEDMSFGASPETLSRWGLVQAMSSPVGLAMRSGLHVSSGRRPGAVTSTGNPSDHGTGHAADFGGSAAAMQGFAQLANRLPGVKQVIYSPLGWARDGGGFSAIPANVGTVLKDHYNHVHVAMHALGGRVGASIKRMARMGGRLTRPTIIDVAGEAGDEQVVPLSPQYRKHGLRNLHEAAAALGATVHEHATGKGAAKAKPAAKPKPKPKPAKKPPTKAQKAQTAFERSQTIAGRQDAALDLQTARQGETPAQLERLRQAAMAQYTKLQTFLKKQGKAVTPALKADVQSAMAGYLRAAKGYSSQINDMKTEAIDAGTDIGEAIDTTMVDVVDAATAAAEAAAAAYAAWRSQWSNKATVLDLALAQAEQTAETTDDAAVLAQLAANARDEYNNLLATMQDGSLDEATRLELASGAAAALRQATQINKQIEDMNAESLASSQRVLSENERRGLSLLGVKTQPGQTQVNVSQYFTQEPNMFAASKGVQWALQGAIA